MEESYENLVKTYDNFKQILVDESYQTINKFVKFSLDKQIYENNDFISFVNNFYNRFNNLTEGLNIPKEINILMKIKLSFTISNLSAKDVDNITDLLILLLKETKTFFCQKLILFNQELYNLSNITIN